jgi:hypothetical protein
MLAALRLEDSRLERVFRGQTMIFYTFDEHTLLERLRTAKLKRAATAVQRARRGHWIRKVLKPLFLAGIDVRTAARDRDLEALVARVAALEQVIAGLPKAFAPQLSPRPLAAAKALMAQLREERSVLACGAGLLCTGDPLPDPPPRPGLAWPGLAGRSSRRSPPCCPSRRWTASSG